MTTVEEEGVPVAAHRRRLLTPIWSDVADVAVGISYLFLSIFIFITSTFILNLSTSRFCSTTVGFRTAVV